MGCDGGTIPKRDELVKTKKKAEQKDKTSELAHRWQNCSITQQPLQQPIVACELGRIYSKESVLEVLLEKSAAAVEASVSSALTLTSHIKSVRDVKTLNLTENPTDAGDGIEKGDGYIDVFKSKWICPVSGQEMNGRHKFVFIWTCGCVLSEKAMKEMNKTGTSASPLECLKCQTPFEVKDVIQLNPSDEELVILEERMEARRSAAKELKKGKKRHAKNEVDTNGLKEVEKTNGHANIATSSTSKLVEPKLKTESESVVKKSKIEMPALKKDVKISKINGSYSVAHDPNASATYKSLFTSSDKAKEQQKAHWVTYNPFYN